MKKCFCLLNHSLTENQIKELETNFEVDEILYPSEKIQTNWAQIKTDKNLDYDLIQEICIWLKMAAAGDVLIIQGEFGTTFCLVDFALKMGLIPLHAVTKRVAKEEINGETVTRHYVFEHFCFRKYEYFKKKVKKCEFSDSWK